MMPSGRCIARISGTNGFIDAFLCIDPRIVLWINNEAFNFAALSTLYHTFIHLFIPCIGNG